MNNKNKVVFLALLAIVVLEYFFLLFTFFPRKAKADFFYPEADNNVSEVELYYGFSYAPRSELSEVNFDLGEVLGRSRSYVSPSEMYLGVQDPLSIWNVTQLSLPPGADVYLQVLAVNKTNHVVGMSKFWLFIQRYGVEGLENIIQLQEPLVYRNIALNYRGNLLTKGGKSIEFQGIGNVSSADSLLVPGLKLKEVYVGQVEQPVKIALDSIVCVEQGRNLALSVRNSSDLSVYARYKDVTRGIQEIIVSPSAEGVEGQKLAVDVGNDISTFELHVKESQPYCIEDSVAGAYVSPLDAHPILFARNDEGKPLWGGIVVSKPLLGKKLCIRRMAYKLTIPLEKCVEKTRYMVEFKQSFVTLAAATELRIPFTISNSGEDSAAPIPVQLEVPTAWKGSSKIEIISELGSVEYVSEVPLIIKNGGFVNGNVVILAPVMFSREQSFDFAIGLIVQGKRSEIFIHPEITGFFEVLDVQKGCGFSAPYIVTATFTANGLVRNPTLLLSYEGGPENNASELGVLIRREGKVVYEGILLPEGVEVELEDMFYPGRVTLQAYLKSPKNNSFTPVLAISGKAAIVRTCPTQKPSSPITSIKKRVLGVKENVLITDKGGQSSAPSASPPSLPIDVSGHNRRINNIPILWLGAVFLALIICAGICGTKVVIAHRTGG